MNFSHTIITGGSYSQIVRNNMVKGGFQRLQEATAPGAFHNSGERFDPPKCHHNTRLAVLKKLMEWVLRQDSNTQDALVMWLYGAAGVGKSAIAQTLAEMCHSSNTLLASFFFSRHDPLRGNALALIATLAYQLVLNLPQQVREHIVATIEQNPLIFTQSLETQFSSLIVQPLQRLAKSGFFANPVAPRLIIIDGLDECDKSPVQCSIIHTIFQSIQSQGLPLLFLIASRPEMDIFSSFDTSSFRPISARLGLDDRYGSSSDIRRFLNDKFEEIKQTHSIRNYIPRSWPTEDVVETLIHKSSGQFIYASTVVKFISSSRHRPTDRLDIVLGIRPIDDEAPFAELDALYINILSGVDDIANVLHILSLLIFSPPNDSWYGRNLEPFLSLNPGDMCLILSDLGSLLSLEERGWSGYLLPRILHASLKDFLLDASRSREFYINSAERHKEYALLSFRHFRNPSKAVYAPHRLFYHCSHAPITQELRENILQLSVESLTTVVRPWRLGTPDGIDRFFSFLESLVWDPDKRLYKNQLALLDQFFMHHLDIYYSNPFLLLVVAAFRNQDISFIFLLPKASKVIDEDRLWLSEAAKNYPKYRELFGNFIEDPLRSGRYCLDGAKYATASIVALAYICNHWSHPVPNVHFDPDKHIRRNAPRRWREKWGRNSVLLAVTKKRKPRPITELYRHIHPYSYKNPWIENDTAQGIFRFALRTLPYLLERADKSKELIDFVRQAQFGPRVKRYPKSTRLAKKAIAGYLGSVPGDTKGAQCGRPWFGPWSLLISGGILGMILVRFCEYGFDLKSGQNRGATTIA